MSSFIFRAIGDLVFKLDSPTFHGVDFSPEQGVVLQGSDAASALNAMIDDLDIPATQISARQPGAEARAMAVVRVALLGGGSDAGAASGPDASGAGRSYQLEDGTTIELKTAKHLLPQSIHSERIISGDADPVLGGFAPRAGDGLKLDGAEVWRIGADGQETLVAVRKKDEWVRVV
ncbi:hypothetical protein FHX49_001303 [Microbacterium endophyticum]|uniref:Uncharacterized protein n=1 Tax=Microbacterium endophyticum TaxID=1526412 RepID=A0A7W4V2L6_9MICO|nr:hypothetical protein [Microbacterium endophyticum]MBB2975736.1 hypothetical protein [Microbacterium endophyticum]NIK36219.1 hypothetical protein [Microbacterium endophyticum]